MSTADLSPLDYAATQATALWRYLAIVVVPVGQSVDHDFELIAWPVRWLALAGVWSLAMIPIFAATSLENGDTKQNGRLWDGADRLRVVAFGVTWLLVALAPRFVMRLPELLNEHQMMLPMVGVSLIVAVCLTPSKEFSRG